ncbi:hypothetical protein L204_100676 [Cryptococcus depauperatus]
MADCIFSLARASISNPRLIPAGISPKSIKWDSYLDCKIVASLPSNAHALTLQVVHGSTTLVSREFSPIHLSSTSVTRRVTHVDKQAAFRYDWPNDGISQTQECFQVIFQDQTDLLSFIERLKSFFTLHVSTIKPITLTCSQQQSQPKEHAKTKIVKPRAKAKKEKKPTTPADKLKIDLSTSQANLTSASLSSFIQPSSSQTPIISSQAATDSIRQQAEPVITSTNNQTPLDFLTSPTISDLKKKLLADYVPSSKTLVEGSTHSTYHNHQKPFALSYPASTNTFSSIKPDQSYTSTDISTSTPETANLISFSSPFPSFTQTPPPSDSTKMPLGGLSDSTIGDEADWPVMLTNEEEKEITRRKLEEDDIDRDIGITQQLSQTQTVASSFASSCFTGNDFVQYDIAHKTALSTAITLAAGFGSCISELSEDKLDLMVKSISYDWKLQDLYIRIRDILDKSILPQTPGSFMSSDHYTNDSPASSFPSTPEAEGEDQYYCRSGYLNSKRYFYDSTTHPQSPLKRPGDFDDDQCLSKRRMIWEGDEVYDDLAEEDGSY